MFNKTTIAMTNETKHHSIYADDCGECTSKYCCAKTRRNRDLRTRAASVSMSSRLLLFNSSWPISLS